MNIDMLMSSCSNFLMAFAEAAGNGIGYEAWQIIRITLLALVVACSIFLIVVVLLQSANSQGVGAVQGSSESFLDKNKGRSFEGIMRKLTIVAVVLLVVFSILFFLSNLLFS